MRELSFIEAFLTENAQYVREKHAGRKGLTVSAKSYAGDLLTEADLTVQSRAADQIEVAYPGDRLVAEEGELARFPEDRHARCWVLDPIDGTNNFVRGLFPVFAISLAFSDGGALRAAGCILPGTNDLFLAERGGGAFLNGKPIQVSGVRGLEAARVEIDFGFIAERAETLERAGALIKAAGQVRCAGSAVCTLCQVACGELDAFVHMTLNPWDYAAAQLIIEEAGGVATRLDGTPLHLFDGKNGVLATNGGVHQALMDLLRQ